MEVTVDGLHNPGALDLRAYWESRKTSDGFVPRGAIQPNEIVSLLPWLFIAEPLGKEWRYRLFGTGLRERLRLEFTGKTTNQIFEPETTELVNGLYDSVAATGTPINVHGRFIGLDIDHAAAEGVNLPVVAQDGQTVLILGGVFFTGVFSGAP